MRITANPDRSVAIQVLRRAVELGVNHIDTAAFYASPGGTLRVGDGPKRYANELIREALAPYPEDLVITTKVGPGEDPERGFYQATTAAELRTQVETNLRQLGVDCLDVVNLRIMKKPGADSIADRFGALADLRDAGLIRQLGVSNVRADHLDEALAIAPVVCVQNSYAIDLRRDEDALIQLCADAGHRLRAVLRDRRRVPRGRRRHRPLRRRPGDRRQSTASHPNRSASPGPSTKAPTSSPSPAPATRPTSKRTSPPAPSTCPRRTRHLT